MIHQILVAFDQLINTLIPGGMVDETLSARAHRARAKDQPVWWWTAYAIDLIFFWQKDSHGVRNHCKASYESEVKRRHLPDHYKQYL